MFGVATLVVLVHYKIGLSLTQLTQLRDWKSDSMLLRYLRGLDNDKSPTFCCKMKREMPAALPQLFAEYRHYISIFRQVKPDIYFIIKVYV